MKPLELAYVGFESPEYLRWREIGPAVFGFELAPNTVDGAVRLRLDQREFRLAVHAGSQDRVR